MRLPISLYAYILSFSRYNDLFVENLRFSPFLPTPVSSEAIVPGVALRPTIRNLGVKNYSPRATWKWKPRDPTVVSFDALPACDRRTDGRTDTPPTATLPSSIAERDKHGENALHSWSLEKEMLTVLVWQYLGDNGRFVSRSIITPSTTWRHIPATDAVHVDVIEAIYGAPV